MHVELAGLMIVGLAMMIGAVVHGSLGFGAVVTAYAAIVLVEPELLPQSIVIASVPITIGVFIRARQSVDWSETARLLLGRLPGVLLGTWIVTVVDVVYLAFAGAGLVLAAVAVTSRSRAIPHTTPALVTTGFFSGLFGTSTGIGGPPLALLYQHGTGDRLRGTVGAVLMLGIFMSVASLVAGGAVSTTDVRTGLALSPFSVAGVMVAPRLQRWVDERISVLVRAVSVAGAILAIVRLSV